MGKSIEVESRGREWRKKGKKDGKERRIGYDKFQSDGTHAY